MENSDARGVVGDYKAGWHDPENATIRFDFGLNEQVVRDISALKNEPEWMDGYAGQGLSTLREPADANLGKYVDARAN